jgi:hypothetical protein
MPPTEHWIAAAAAIGTLLAHLPVWLVALRRIDKGGPKMSEQPDAPVATAPAVVDVAFHPAAAPVVQAVQATMPPTANWAETAASVLQALMPVVQPAEQIGRASARTQGEVAIGLAALTAILQVFFPHPAATAA